MGVKEVRIPVLVPPLVTGLGAGSPPPPCPEAPFPHVWWKRLASDALFGSVVLPFLASPRLEWTFAFKTLPLNSWGPPVPTFGVLLLLASQGARS